MKLPDWAHFCERCGTRLDGGGGKDDLIERVGLDDTSAQEPLWNDSADAREEEGAEPFVPETQDVTHAAALHDMPTVLMGAVEEVREESDAFVASNRKTNIEMWPASEAAEKAAMAAGGQTQRIDMEQLLADDEQADGDERAPRHGKAPSIPGFLQHAVKQDEDPDATRLVPKTPDEDEYQDEAAPHHGYGDVQAGADESDRLDEDAPEPADEQEARQADGGAEEAAEDETAVDEAAEDEYAGQDAADADEDQDEEADASDAQEPDEQEAGLQQGVVFPNLPHMVIDVGDQDSPYGVDPRLRHQMHNTWEGRQRPSERHKEESTRSMAIVAALAAVIVLVGLGVVFSRMGTGATSENAGEAAIVTHRISQQEASDIVKSLDGWWATGRTFDGRYWHIQDGIMETYAADGILAKEVLIDPSAVERMDNGPGGVEGAGYYLRNIAFYLLDADRNVLHAIDTDGSAYEEANLFRSEAPAFITAAPEGEQAAPTPVEEGAAGEYILPESATRVYEISELEALSDHDLFVARNEIYARHGYTFEAGELSEYFSSKSWYHPSDVFNEGDITDIERQNVSNILSVEQSRGSQYV